MSSQFRSPWVLALMLTVTGCNVGQDYHRPEFKTAQTWDALSLPNDPPLPATSPTTKPTSVIVAGGEVQIIQWWAQLGDAQLNSLVECALQANLDLKQATARIQQSRAQLGVVRAAEFPAVDSSGQYARSYSRGLPSSGVDLFRAGLDASWELDIFGGIRRSVEAARGDLEAAVEDRRDVLVTLVSEVAVNYIQLRSFQRQIVIARENLEAQQKSADVTRRRMQFGLTAGLDIANAEANVASTASVIPVLESEAEQTIYVLGLLLGQQPGLLTKELSTPAPIPTVPPSVPVGLPSELLRRRPDVRRAERQLAAATARIGQATADLFPQFSLAGSLGLQSSHFKSLGDYASRYWSIGPSVSWPVVDFGRIRSQVDVQNALQQQALSAYEKAILTALSDVEKALVAYGKEQVHNNALRNAVAANRRAVDLANRLYAAGQTNFLNVLDAERSLFSSEDALVQSDSTIATNLVALYKSLGGGWETAAPAVAVK